MVNQEGGLMATYRIQSPDGQSYDVTAPDGAQESEILAYAQKNYAPKKEAEKPWDPTEGQSFGRNALQGIGKAFVDAGTGLKQMVGFGDRAQVDENRRLDRPLMNTAGGVVGNIGGNVAMALPTAFIPGVNTLTGAGLVGAGMGAMQPVGQEDSRLENTALGGITGVGAQFGMNKLAGAAANRLAAKTVAGDLAASQNAPRDAILKASQEAGYTIPPSMAGAGMGSRMLEGLSGKYKTNQLAGIRNQTATETLARKAMGLAPEDAITPEAMQGIRTAAFQKGYEPVAAIGTLPTDKAFITTLDGIASNFGGASKSFPLAVKTQVKDMVESLKVPEFDAGDALKMTQLLRNDANKAFVSGDKDLGKALKEASTALESQIERRLEGLGKDGAGMLKDFRDARTAMAKSHDVERALVSGGGQVNAGVFGKMLQKSPGRLTGELKQIGEFANQFGDVAKVPKSGHANPFTIVDFGMGASGIAPLLPPARVAARYGILSPQYQKAFVGSSYGAGLLGKAAPDVLGNEQAQWLARIMGQSALNSGQ